MGITRQFFSALCCTLLSTCSLWAQEQPLVVAYPAATAPTLDGQIGAGEYAETLPLYVDFAQPDVAPGIVPNTNPVPDAADLSFTLFALYTSTDLYIAVEVTDDLLLNDSPGGPWDDDDVEVFIDGDLVANDGVNSPEGFQLITDVGGDRWGISPEAWFSAVGQRPGGWVAEFRIPLSFIDTQDGDGTQHPVGGDLVGFNIATADDDTGGGLFSGEGDTFAAFSGSYANWHYNKESDWGRLLFSPNPSPPTAIGASTWGTLKENLAKRWP